MPEDQVGYPEPILQKRFRRKYKPKSWTYAIGLSMSILLGYIIVLWVILALTLNDG